MESGTGFSASSSSSMLGVSVPTASPSICFGASSPVTFSFGSSFGSGQTGNVIGSTSSSPPRSTSLSVPGAPDTGSFGSFSRPSTDSFGSSTTSVVFRSGEFLSGSSTATAIGYGSAPATEFSLTNPSASCSSPKASLIPLISGKSEKGTTSTATNVSSSTGNTSSLLLALKSSPTDSLPSLGSDEVTNIKELESEGVKMLTCQICEFSFVEREQAALDVVKESQVAIDNNVLYVESGLSVAPSTNIVVKEMTSNPSQVHDLHEKACSLEETCEALESRATQVLKKQKTTEVVDEDSDHPISVSEDCADSKRLNHLFTSRTSYIIIHVLRKYGDISAGTILQTEKANAAFLQLVAKVVEKLQSHTLDTLTGHEIQMIQKLTNDAATVGFHVEWLKERIQQIVTLSEYRKLLMQLSDLVERIGAAKIALSEMELQRVDLDKKIDSMKAETDKYKFSESNLALLEMELQRVDLDKKIDSMKAETDKYKFSESNLCEGLF